MNVETTQRETNTDRGDELVKTCGDTSLQWLIPERIPVAVPSRQLCTTHIL